MLTFRKRRSRTIPTIVISLMIVSSVALAMLVNKPNASAYSSSQVQTEIKQSMNEPEAMYDLADAAAGQTPLFLPDVAENLQLPPLDADDSHELLLEDQVTFGEDNLVKHGEIYQQDV